MTGDVIAKRQQQVLHDKKWLKFLRRTWLFRHIPFVEFVLAAGSLATGNVHEGSDFDVIVGAKYGRIFTARFLAALLFGVFGWRRKKWHGVGTDSAANKVCFNHFVTEKSYRLSPPHSEYWRNLYQNLVPIYGPPEKINEFFAANADWASQSKDLRCPYIDDLRHRHKSSSWLKTIFEQMLKNRLGDWLESRLRLFQVARIEKSLKKDPGYKPRIIYGDAELEFHPHTKRIEEYLEKFSEKV